MAEQTTNFRLTKDAQTDYYNIETVNANLDKIDQALGNTAKFEMAGGTATAITLTGIELLDGHSKTFIVSADNNGSATKINGKPLYKPGTTETPKLTTGRAVTVWYDASGDCFFFKASATGDAVAGDVLAGRKFSNDEDTDIEGTIPILSDTQATEATNFGTAVVLRSPKGYFDGISPKSYLWASDPNYIASNIREGKSIFGLIGSAKVVDAPSAITGLQVVTGFSEIGGIRVTYNMPSDGRTKGVRIMYKTGSYPTSPTDGSVFYNSNDGAIVTNPYSAGFAEGTTYYFTAFAYNYQGATRLYSGYSSGSQGYGAPYRTQGMQIFTSSGTFTVPYGVNKIDVFCVGGGGGGNSGYIGSPNMGGGGGGGGYTATVKNVNVTQGQQFAVVVGAGGNGTSELAGWGTGGGTSSVAGICAAEGGKAGYEPGAQWRAGDGGSGGGTGGNTSLSLNCFPGGSDGAGVNNGWPQFSSKGQGRTTRAFEEAWNTLYSGGGGGGRYGGGDTSGGAGGGGNGAIGDNSGTAGAPNTGGGGGGGTGVYTAGKISGSGGSGIVIIRWGY